MYLVELDEFSGLVRVDGEFDGVRSIKEFREIINDPELGVECFTAIALTADYLTPIKYYSEEDRPYKAMGIVTGGNRRAFIWHQDKIQKALLEYDRLQYNPTIEEKRTLDAMLLGKLKEIRDLGDDQDYPVMDKADENNIVQYIEDNRLIKSFLNEKPWKEFSPEVQKSIIRKANSQVIIPNNEKVKEDIDLKLEEKRLVLFKQLETIKKLIENFNKQNEDKDIFSEGVVRNGYKLTRLEIKAIDKNAFYHKENH